MRYGFTTGSCAAAAAKAAAYMLLTGKEKTKITIYTPKGIPYHAAIEAIERKENKVACAVRKDGGDDPDVTTGSLVYAEVTVDKEEKGASGCTIAIEGGTGIGRVTKPGLDQPVGNAAINRVPRKMIAGEVEEVCRLTDFIGCLSVVISMPDGERLAHRTFNPRLGIVGGISILGTTGIVEPMSMQALLDTIQAELKIKRAEGHQITAVAPGNYGLEFMKEAYGYDLDKSVKCSNFIGATIDMAADLGFKELLLTGHIGKLVKLAGGIMNTHSKEGDCRMELLTAAGIKAGITGETASRMLRCVVTEEAVRILKRVGKLEAAMALLMEQVCLHLNKRAGGRLKIECILYASDFGELVRSKGAKSLIDRIAYYTGGN